MRIANTCCRENADLFWWMAGGTVVVWLGMVALASYAIWARPEAHTERP